MINLLTYLLTLYQKILDNLSVVNANNIPNDIIPPKKTPSWDQT